MKEFDVIVIGAGGAGMFCASQAAKRGRAVALLEHSNRLGRKILISGGGRCNFTNLHASPKAFVSNNPHFCKSALARYTPDDFVALVKKHGIAFHEKKLGQLFCDGSAQQIVSLLQEECESASAQFFLDCHVTSVSKNDRFCIETNLGQFQSQSLVVATGGLSVPQVGATGFGYQLASQFRLSIVETQPALDGFVFGGNDLRRFTELTGVSLDTIVTCNNASFRENVLFTHTGLSGPASLQASLYWRSGDAIRINVLPNLHVAEWLQKEKLAGSRIDIKNILAEHLPKRFAEMFCQVYKMPTKLAELSSEKLGQFSQALSAWEIRPDSTVGYKKAEVTRGGVDTNELSSQTMESKKVPGLYFIGEVVDVTGQLGGYNFQWAWSSAFAAGQHL